jgi:ABC-2 type transport system ATP-binding protein
MNAIEVSGIRKAFRERGEDIHALRGIDLRIRSGQAFGLLGPNGAGKTTLIYILSTLVIPTSGTARVLGHDVVRESDEIKKRIGICMGGTHFYWDLRPREILNYFGRLYGMSPSARKRNTDMLIKRFGIQKFEGKEFGELSTGMRQKLAVAKSLLNDPEVLFLDEPTAGLDVEVALDVRNFILDLIQERDMTVLLTSHQMGEVEQMCRSIAIINQGRLVSEGNIRDIRDSLKVSDVIHLYLDSYKKLGFLKRIPGIIHYGVSDGLFITVDSGKDRVSSILSALKKERIAVLDMEMRKPSLEEIFLTVVGKGGSPPVRLKGGYNA